MYVTDKRKIANRTSLIVQNYSLLLGVIWKLECTMPTVHNVKINTRTHFVDRSALILLYIIIIQVLFLVLVPDSC
jgi:hypothetical protein